ncbi:MAG: hypothetical protein KGZ85_14380 [Ignavibacterium sp.]|nr:hypothetical protein [Ignavibacterium sp.]
MIKIIISTILISIILPLHLYPQDKDTLSTPEKTDTVFIMQKSPWGAVLRSAVIPGWGQFYNESYWKIPVVWGFAGWFIYNWINTNDNYVENQDIYLNTNEDIYRRRRDFYRDQRDNFAIYLALTYLLNLVDAYVDAHLFDFTVSEDYLTRSPQLNIRFNF